MVNSLKGIRTKCKWVRVQSKVRANFNIEQDFHKFILVVDEVEKSKQIHNEIDILINTKDKAPDPAVIETAEDEHKEISKWTSQVRILIAIYLKVTTILDF